MVRWSLVLCIGFCTISRSQSFTEILCRPTDSTMTMSVLFTQNVEVYWEYGTSSQSYLISTPSVAAAKDTPRVVIFPNLLPDTKYYYRTRYRAAGTAGAFSAGPERYFHTQRARGSAFSFTVQSDAHPYDKKGSHTLLYTALNNQLNDRPDFLLDLGDTFGDDHEPFTITSNEIRQLHLNWRSFFGTAAHSVPLFLCIGNHEGESGYYLLQTPPANLGVYATMWRKFYFPNPVPDRFYSGNTTQEPFGMGAPENYYAWEWGDALFVVLDVYRYATASASPGVWDWTIGAQQYQWLQNTLENSTAKFKFVFAHHIRGYGRGAATQVNFFEWGGNNNNGSWGFTANRPGWAMPIHQLMVKTGVTIFFQGHDHLFAKEVVDGIVYQEVPMPSDSTYIIGTRDNGDAYTDVKMDASGHLRVTVTPSAATVDYVRAWLPADETALHKNGETAYSYSVLPRTTSVRTVSTVPSEFTLGQNFPNPFNPSTLIAYSIPSSGMVRLSVFDMLGRTVALLVDEEQSSGAHQAVFNGQGLPSGVYFYQLTSQGVSLTKRAVLTK